MGGDFTDLRVWRAAVELVAATAALVPSMRGTAARAAADQALRAAESIPANIAEGYGRGLGDDFARFLRIAGASAAELESHLRVAVAAGRLPGERTEPIIAHTRAVRAMIRGLTLSVSGRRPPQP